jgi:drug/metabolite transporter (DMT)-like permease
MSTQTAILLLVAGNLVASLSDVAVKGLNGEISSFQYVFLRQLLSVCLLWPFWWRLPQAERGVAPLGWNLLRAHLILMGSGCMLVAITYLPLTTANAVFYIAPLLVLPRSAVLLKERLSLRHILMSGLGFAGVLVVLRPSTFHWAAFFALGTALCLALFHVTGRFLKQGQAVVTTLFWTSVLSLPVSGALAIFNWQPLSALNLSFIVASALCILLYNGLAFKAYHSAAPGRVSVAENSGLIFVTLFGFLWFDELPDALTIVGVLLIVIPLMPWGRYFRSAH